MVRPVRGGCWWAIAAVLVAPLLWAGPAGAETILEVEAGYAGSFVPGQEVPVRVRVSADRLLRGTLEVGVGTPENGTPVAMAVEVPGGGQKEFLLTARAGLNQSPDVVARLRQGDRVLASGQASVRATVDTELVGLLPGAIRGRAVPGPAALAVDVGTARFALVGEAELERAPASLGPLSTLAADADELGRLSPGARTGVLRWIESGGRLLVDTAKGQTVAGLPDGWQPGTRGRASAGLGEVVATDGAIAAGRWSGLVEPSGWGSASSRFGGQLPVAASLASDAGLRTPEIGWLVGFLAVYVVVVGPLLFLALRRAGRPELAWIAIPLVAILFSTGSYAVGRNLRKATRLVHATVLSTGPAGPVAVSYVGVFSRGGETTRIGFPAGWSGGAFAQMGQSAAAASLVTSTPDGPESHLPLDAGQFGMVHATGPAPLSGAGVGGLEIVATAGRDGGITGSVRNPTAFRLDRVAAFVGSDAVLIGPLAPGEQQPFSVANAGQMQMMDGGGSAFRVWQGMRTELDDGPVNFDLWQAALQSGGLNFLSPNAVVAAGWTREFVPEVRIDGRIARPEGRTVILGRQQVEPVAQGPTTLAVRRDIVRDPFANRLRGGRPAGSVVRFVLPEGADTSKLVLRSPFGSAELWQDGGWLPAACNGAACQRGPAVNCAPGDARCQQQPRLVNPRFPPVTDLVVPAAAVRSDGVIYARLDGPASIDQGASLTVGRLA